MPLKHWIIQPPAQPDLLASYEGMSRIMAQVLYNRALTNPQDAYRFLNIAFTDPSPFTMKGMNKAVQRIRQAIKKKEPIAIYGDFDADGVTSTALLVQTLTALKAHVRPYIPHRVDEGYGLNSEALLKLARQGVKLVITVDCGIRSIDEVVDANAEGLDIIITDHHTVGAVIPNAFAVINPKQEDCPYPEDMLAGVGIAYRLAEALLLAAKSANERDIPLTTDDLIDLVAIGTIADLAPMNRLENRALVKRGLDQLSNSKRPGIRALLNIANAKSNTINTETIGYTIAPRINAAGRLADAMLAYNLLMAQNEEEAQKLAAELDTLNVNRQELTRAAQETVHHQLNDKGVTDAPLIIASDSSFLPGIVGLVAGRLAEEFYRPVIVMETGEHESRASCRSIPQFDITHALDQCADLLVRHGGHAQAAGFTIENGNIPQFRDRLMAIAHKALDGQTLAPILNIDAEIKAEDINFTLLEELQRLHPTGNQHDAPTFMTRNLRVQEYRRVGKTENHLKVRFATDYNILDAIGFGLGEFAEEMPDCVDAVYMLEYNDYNGNRLLQLNLLDIRPADNTQ